MKKFFDLARALAGEPVVTRSGLEVDKIVHFPDRVMHPVVAHLKGYDSIYQVAANGKVPPHSHFPYATNERSDYDLFMATKTRTVFVNVYEHGNVAGVFNTAEKANRNAELNVSRVVAQAVPIVVEE